MTTKTLPYSLVPLLFFFQLIFLFGEVCEAKTSKNEKDPLVKTFPSITDTTIKIQDSDDKTLSPYFFIKSEDPSVDQMPLLSSSADVSIAGVIADVVVSQVYKNDGRKPIEAIYVFPASTRAAVYAMKMTIGDRTIEAKIKEKEAARKAYEQAKSEGKTASLLEQERPNVFQMNVANIMPGDSIVVEMKYTELLVPNEAIYEFMYPTVVGPRYSNKTESEAPNDKWVANPYLKEGEKPQTTFNINVDITSGVPIQDVACISHKTSVNYDGEKDAAISLDPSEKNGGNRDFILRYRLAGNRIESGLMLYEGKDENFFLAMIQPPKRITQDMIPNREYLYVIDISGSMHGQPLDVSKKMMTSLLSQLKPTETFNILLFSGGSKVFSERPVQATKENIKNGLNFITSARGGGGTELVSALKRAMALPKAEKGSRSIVVITDGYVSFEKETFDVIRQNLNEANLFSVGIGSSVNRFLIEGMARAGSGEPLVITLREQEQIQKKADKFQALIQYPVLTQIKTEYDDFEVYDVEPLSVPDVFANRPILLYGKWKGKPEGEIVLTGYSGDDWFEKTLEVKNVKPEKSNAALKYLWARNKIAMLNDFNNVLHTEEHKKEITELGLKYNLLTNYTSFVAIDSKVRNTSDTSVTVKQPLPLPEGVSNYAVGSPSVSSYGGKRMKTLMGVGMGGRGMIAADELEQTSEEPKAVKPGKSEKVTPKLVVDSVVVKSGTLSEASIKLVLQKQIRSLNACLKYLKNKTIQKGQLQFKLVVDTNGKVIQVIPLNSTLKDVRVSNCLRAKLLRLRFAKSTLTKQGNHAIITFKVNP